MSTVHTNEARRRRRTAGRRVGNAGGRRRHGRVIRRGSPEWNAAIDAALAEAVAAGRLPARPPARVLDRVAELLILKEHERALRRQRTDTGAQ